MQVTLKFITPDAVAHIGEAASICYDSDVSREACIRRAGKCKDSGHLATMRFAYADFEIDGISRVCSHQIVRLAHAGLLQRSQRYVKETKVEYIDPPAVALLPVDVAYKWALIQDMAEELYLHLVDTKLMKKEDARYILPQGCATKLRMCLNFQAWQDFLNNRCHPAAQWEVRTVAMEIRNQLTQLAPELFGD